jgi:hypothetical protein
MKIEYLRDSVVLNIAVTIFYSINMAFSLWERLPAANIALAACCQGLSPLSAVRKKMTERSDIHKSSIFNSQ